MNRQELTARAGDLQQWGGTRLVTLGDGVERGVRAVEFRTTAGLEFAVLVDRGMDVAWARYRGRSIAWHAPVGFSSPAYAEIDDGLGWLRSFSGGLFNTAGLDHILFPEVDPHDTYTEAARANGTAYGIHGRVATIPGRLTAYGEEWRDGVCHLFAEAEIRQATTLGESLGLVRRVETTLDGRSISWTDRVENVWTLETPHMLLYHINFGAPLLSERCELHLPTRAIRWATPSYPEGDTETYKRFAAPEAGFQAQAIEHDMHAGADGRVRAALVNHDDPERPWGIQLDYDAERFPYFFQWRFLAAGNYVTAFEPSTNGAQGRAAAREAGELTLLAPGESRISTTVVTVLDGETECREAAQRVAAVVA
jgi:hypothetical protein